jgi:hypothetical protein
MLWLLTAATLVVWLLVWLSGFGGSLVHLLLLVVLAFVVMQLVSARRTR